MTIYNMIFMNFSWILFPIMLFLIYEAYSESINTKQNKIFLNFCLTSAIYLIIRCGTFENYKRIIEVTLDTTIITLYLKRYYKSALIATLISTIIMINLNLEIVPIMIKYIMYIYAYKEYNKNQTNNIILTYSIRTFFLITTILITSMQKYEMIEYISYYLLTFIIIVFIIRAEKIIQVHISYKELMKECRMKESLFKISHEIKNPIAVCKGYLDICENNKNYEKYIPIIKTEINKTLNLLQDFSACNKVKIEPDIIDVIMLIEEITNNLKIIADKQNIKLIVEQLQEEILINGDYNRLNQVLLNIIKNSIEAKDKNKKSYIKIYTKTANRKIKIYIEDNGIGINKENIKKIGDPFFTTKQNGTGLGVLLSKEIINAHNGNIEYKSKEGEGTIVVITLPIIEY